MPAPTKKKPDWDLQQDVACELAWDTRIAPTEIGIAVKGGVVTLTGTVDSWAKVRAVDEAVHRVSGVVGLVNELVVELPGSSQKADAEIARAVRQALEWDVTVPDRQISSSVSHGTVTLEGKVAFWSARADAERAVERLTGVKHVVNRIEVAPEQPLDAGEARRTIEQALARHARREARHLDVRTVDGTVTVTGVVQSWSEKEAVAGALRGTRGVRQVVNDLVIQPQD